MNHESIELERIKIALVQRISNQLLGVRVDLNETEAFICDAVDMWVQGYLWGETGKSETIKYPRTWWDAFKLRWFPVWLLIRYPVRYQCHEISVQTLYPNFRVSMPTETSVLKWQIANFTEPARLDK